jgi:predicted permease
VNTIVAGLPALQGFFTIAALVGLGWILAWRGVLQVEHRQYMSLLALWVASPALMFTTMVDADLGRVFSTAVLAAYGSIAAVGLVYLVLARLVWRPRVPHGLIGLLLSCYSNAGNLGIPVAAYALHDVTWVVPILLIQVVVLQPTALAILDWYRAKERGARLSVGRLVSLPVRNPLTVGVLLGLGANLAHGANPRLVIPEFVVHPVQMLGAVTIPLMLLAFGVSLRLDPKPAKGGQAVESWVVVALKVVVQPLVAYTLAAWVLHLDPATVRAVTVVAGLPSAQNIFIFAARYDQRLVFARDTIFHATIVSVVTVIGAALMLA